MTTPTAYLPDRGDLVWLDFDPQVGREQSGHRPALVLSRAKTHPNSRMAFVVPITTQAKGYVVEVPLPPGLPVSGVLLCDQMKSLDWQARNMRWVGTAPPALLNTVLLKVLSLIS